VAEVRAEPDTDQDGDQVPDCIDPCPSNPEPTASAEQGCVTIVDETMTTDSTGGPADTGSGGGATNPPPEPRKEDKKGCGCRMEAHGEPPSSLMHFASLLALFVVVGRRRARPNDLH
jgi:MYXO-CTERM domain-containing protein